ncbi:BRCA2-interacting transcriptional repressor EMSY-like isoform X1 [Mytilus edulis]|uniref:BRCA2-interacting transcriptional repressor EMSY-like isoform X1 n=1 Tax=Mytilus edulis TaxID=6550 RepID=UPI0039EF4A14
MWPLLLDMTRDDSKRILRRLELEAYSSLISAFRAQGDLTKEKKKILQDLQYYLSISTERHRAEVRRAINDEKLCTVADYVSGPNTMSEWLIEGRRLIPLMPRLVPQTAFTAKANEAANLQAEKNASMPVPSLTGNKDLTVSSSPPLPVNNNVVTKTNRPTSPNSNVVVLPSGMSIHIKGGLNTEDEDEGPERKRRRSHSSESLVSPSASTQTPRVTYTTTTPSPVTGISPMKITISKSPRSQMTTTATQSQKVILVSSGQTSPNVLQKSITVPVVKTSTNLTGSNKASIILPNSTGTSTVITTPTMVSAGSGTSVTSSTMTFLTPTVSIPRPRVKTFPRQRFPNVQQGVQKPGVVIPMGPQPPNPQTVQNIHIKSVKSPNVQIRQEGGMKIISAGGSGKILPKISQTTSASGTPVVVVSAGSSLSSSSNVTMVTRPITSIGQSGAKILNITTQGGKIISTGTARNPNVVTVNPKTLQLHAVKTSGNKLGGKPNVIVVQKTQPRRSISTPTSTASKTIKSSAFEKELVNFLQRQDSTKHIVVSTPSGQRTIERKVIVTTPGQLEATRQRIRMEAEAKNNNILADLIKAAGIQEGEGSGDVTINLDEATMAALTASSQGSEQNRVVTSQALPSNEWFEYDDGNQAYTSQGIDNQALQAIIDSQPSTSQDKPKVTVQRASSIDLSQLNVDQLSQQQYYTIEQAMRMLNQPDKTAEGVSILRMDSSEGETQQTEVETTVIQEEIPGAAIQVSNQNSQSELEQIAQRLNLQGELDPQTGIFYNTNSSTDNSSSSSSDITQSQIVVSAGAKSFDLLSSSLEQAQINLDSYQFMEEDILTEKVTTEAVGQPGTEVVEVSSTPYEVYTSGTEESVGQETVIVSSSNEGSHMGPMIRIKSASSSSFIPIQEISKSSTINITTHTQPSTSVIHEAVLSQEEGIYTAEIIDDSNPNITQNIDSSFITTVPSSDVPVTIETTSVDPVEVEGEIVGLEDIGTISNTSSGANSGVDSGDPNLDAVRLSKRKRRPPSALEDSPTSQSIGWAKSCLWLIQRVSKYRGLSRDKGEMNAASWFLKPVDPNDAPDYYNIIKSPMDFGTIKRKLEMGSCNDYEDFHSDMLLVRDNCRTYNPPGSVVRRDCDEVFAFYMSEYEKLLEKWQKVQFPSPASKKLKFESRSPVK